MANRHLMFNSPTTKPARLSSLRLLFISAVLILIFGGRYWWYKERGAKEITVEGIKRFGGKTEEVGSDYLIVYDPAKDIKERFFLSSSVPVKQTTHFVPKDLFSGSIKPPKVTESVPSEKLEKGDDVTIFYTEDEGKLIIQRIELVKFRYE